VVELKENELAGFEKENAGLKARQPRISFKTNGWGLLDPVALLLAWLSFVGNVSSKVGAASTKP
jgi:hypothetical protein